MFSRYHYHCALQKNLVTPSLQHEPYIPTNELFLCEEHKQFENDFSLKAMVLISISSSYHSLLYTIYINLIG